MKKSNNAKFTLINTTKTTLTQSAIMQYLHSKRIYADCIYAPKNNDDLYTLSELELITEDVKDSDIIGFSSFAISERRTLQLMKFIKNEHPHIHLIIGGPSAIMDAERLIQKECVDSLCIHEGEIPLKNLIKNFYSGEYKDINGIWFKGKNKNPLQSGINNLDMIPFFNYKNDDYGTYKKLKQGKLIKDTTITEIIENPCMFGKFLYILASRGCPYNCSYCINDKLKTLKKNSNTKFIRKRSNKNLINDLETIIEKDHDIDNIFFFDDDFMIRTEKEIEEFSRLYKERINLPFYIFANPNSTTIEKLERCCKAGLSKVEFGVQTVSERTLKKYNRINSNEKIKQIISHFRNNTYNTVITMDFITNSPFEDESDVIQNIEFIMDLDGDFLLYIHNLHIFPGSRLYEEYKGFTGNEGKEFQNNLIEGKMFNEYVSLILMAMQGSHSINNPDQYGTLTREEIKYLLHTRNSKHSDNIKLLKEKIKNTEVAKFYSKFSV